ncbi:MULTISPECIES: hypothetical protein [Sinorhizobium]|uniref:hypothetical protein n=1 Tax=Sinorhizobium TaxID=28105 RepID=UPI0011A1D629|nr:MULTISPECIES: hypothetical protein [Sinorhizobium]MDW9439244.1 hypothetical protein [Sinorhizobium meliloti]MDW9484067.1 hypothetical protein [Sinorhizobium meliloti]MDX0523520.1 hypothetical protein [Sinorhizobium medicae]MDX0634243.1 hypothetical protein [Sinorhizobium medicae]MQV61383.1 hypothetical protein [Sinorhizobium meliloti]
MEDFEGKSTAELLTLHAAVMEELRKRNVLRSANSPTGDLAEYLFCAAFGWMQAANSVKAYDATYCDGIKYQIKGRRIHRRNKSRQLSAIRDLEGFDYLPAVLFDDDFNVRRAALIPAITVKERSVYVAQTNSYKFVMRDAIWDMPNVLDVTDQLHAVS